MNVELQLGRTKRQTRIFIDGVEQKGILDFSVDLHNLPTITLKVWPESMKIIAPNLRLIDQHVRDKQGRYELSRQLRYAIGELFRSVRQAVAQLGQIWAEANPRHATRRIEYW